MFDWSNNTSAIDVKRDQLVPEEKSTFKMLGFSFSSKLDWGSYIISIAKTSSKKIETLIRFMKFLLLCISVNLLYGLAWNTVVMTVLVLLAATWKCWISCKN